MNNIAAMFDLDPKCSVWIVRKSGNIVLWPHGGMFSGPLLAVGGVYEVKGQSLHPQPASDSPSPFGAYMVSPYSGTSQKNAPVHSPMKKKKTWSKTVEVVLLKKR